MDRVLNLIDRIESIIRRATATIIPSTENLIDRIERRRGPWLGRGRGDHHGNLIDRIERNGLSFSYALSASRI